MLAIAIIIAAAVGLFTVLVLIKITKSIISGMFMPGYATLIAQNMVLYNPAEVAKQMATPEGLDKLVVTAYDGFVQNYSWWLRSGNTASEQVMFKILFLNGLAQSWSKVSAARQLPKEETPKEAVKHDSKG